MTTAGARRGGDAIDAEFVWCEGASKILFLSIQVARSFLRLRKICGKSWTRHAIATVCLAPRRSLCRIQLPADVADDNDMTMRTAS